MIKKGDRVMSLKDGSTGHIVFHDTNIKFYRVRMDKLNALKSFNYRWFIPQELVRI